MHAPATPSLRPNPGANAAEPVSAHIESLRAYLQADPANLTLQCELCDVLLDNGQTQGALELLQAALRQHPGHIGLRYRLGVVQRRLGQLEAARDTLGQLVQEGTQADALLYELACVHAMLHEAAPAAELLAQVVTTAGYASRYPDADVWLLRMLHQDGQLDAALAHGLRVLASDRPDWRVLAAMATLYIDNDQIDEAGQLLGRLGAQGPAADLSAAVQAELASAQGFVALRGEDLTLARQHFETSLHHDGGFARSLLGLGLVLAASGELAPAQAWLGQAVQAMPSHIGSWHALAWLQLAQDDLAGAQASFAQAFELDTAFGESHGAMALMAALRGDRASAQEHCKIGRRLDKHALNVMAAQLVLQHGSLRSPQAQQAALALLAKQPGLNQSSMAATLARFAGGRG